MATSRLTRLRNRLIGAVLSQRSEGEERVVAYGSRLLSNAEWSYGVTHRELLAIVHFTKFYRQNLLGRPLMLWTDHIALQWHLSNIIISPFLRSSSMDYLS